MKLEKRVERIEEELEILEWCLGDCELCEFWINGKCWFEEVR